MICDLHVVSCRRFGLVLPHGPRSDGKSDTIRYDFSLMKISVRMGIGISAFFFFFFGLLFLRCFYLHAVITTEPSSSVQLVSTRRGLYCFSRHNAESSRVFNLNLRIEVRSGPLDCQRHPTIRHCGFHNPTGGGGCVPGAFDYWALAVLRSSTNSRHRFSSSGEGGCPLETLALDLERKILEEALIRFDTVSALDLGHTTT